MHCPFVYKLAGGRNQRWYTAAATEGWVHEYYFVRNNYCIHLKFHSRKEYFDIVDITWMTRCPGLLACLRKYFIYAMLKVLDFLSPKWGGVVTQNFAGILRLIRTTNWINFIKKYAGQVLTHSSLVEFQSVFWLMRERERAFFAERRYSIAAARHGIATHIAFSLNV